MKIKNISMSVLYPNYNAFVNFLNKRFNNKYYILLDKKYIKYSIDKILSYNVLLDSSMLFNIRSGTMLNKLSEDKFKKLNILTLTYTYNIDNIDYKYYDTLKQINFEFIENSGIDLIAVSAKKDTIILNIYSFDKHVLKNIDNMFELTKQE